MKKKEFHFTDVLGVITMTIFKPQGMDGVGSLLSFMTEENLEMKNYGSARIDCLPELIKQFPSLDPNTKEMQAALSELKPAFNLNSADRDVFIKEWLEKFKNCKFGIECSEFLAVSRLPFSPKSLGIFYTDGMRGVSY